MGLTVWTVDALGGEVCEFLEVCIPVESSEISSSVILSIILRSCSDGDS